MKTNVASTLIARTLPCLDSGWLGRWRRVRVAGIGLLFGLSLCLTVDTGAASCVSVPSGLVSWWRAETNATDVLGGNGGTLQGGAGFAPGKVGQAFSFNNINASVQVPNAA